MTSPASSLDKNNFTPLQNELKSLTKEGVLGSYLVVEKNGSLHRVNGLRLLWENVRELFGYSNRADSYLVKEAASELISRNFNEINSNEESSKLVIDLAKKVGLIAKDEQINNKNLLIKKIISKALHTAKTENNNLVEKDIKLILNPKETIIPQAVIAKNFTAPKSTQHSQEEEMHRDSKSFEDEDNAPSGNERDHQQEQFSPSSSTLPIDEPQKSVKSAFIEQLDLSKTPNIQLAPVPSSVTESSIKENIERSSSFTATKIELTDETASSWGLSSIAKGCLAIIGTLGTIYAFSNAMGTAEVPNTVSQNQNGPITPTDSPSIGLTNLDSPPTLDHIHVSWQHPAPAEGFSPIERPDYFRQLEKTDFPTPTLNDVAPEIKIPLPEQEEVLVNNKEPVQVDNAQQAEQPVQNLGNEHIQEVDIGTVREEPFEHVQDNSFNQVWNTVQTALTIKNATIGAFILVAAFFAPRMYSNYSKNQDIPTSEGDLIIQGTRTGSQQIKANPSKKIEGPGTPGSVNNSPQLNNQSDFQAEYIQGMELLAKFLNFQNLENLENPEQYLDNYAMHIKDLLNLKPNVFNNLIYYVKINHKLISFRTAFTTFITAYLKHQEKNPDYTKHDELYLQIFYIIFEYGLLEDSLSVLGDKKVQEKIAQVLLKLLDVKNDQNIKETMKFIEEVALKQVILEEDMVVAPETPPSNILQELRLIYKLPVISLPEIYAPDWLLRHVEKSKADYINRINEMEKKGQLDEILLTDLSLFIFRSPFTLTAAADVLSPYVKVLELPEFNKQFNEKPRSAGSSLISFMSWYLAHQDVGFTHITYDQLYNQMFEIIFKSKSVDVITQMTLPCVHGKSNQIAREKTTQLLPFYLDLIDNKIDDDKLNIIEIIYKFIEINLKNDQVVESKDFVNQLIKRVAQKYAAAKPDMANYIYTKFKDLRPTYPESWTIIAANISALTEPPEKSQEIKDKTLEMLKIISDVRMAGVKDLSGEDIQKSLKEVYSFINVKGINLDTCKNIIKSLLDLYDSCNIKDDPGISELFPIFMRKYHSLNNTIEGSKQDELFAVELFEKTVLMNEFYDKDKDIEDMLKLLMFHTHTYEVLKKIETDYKKTQKTSFQEIVRGISWHILSDKIKFDDCIDKISNFIENYNDDSELDLRKFAKIVDKLLMKEIWPIYISRGVVWSKDDIAKIENILTTFLDKYSAFQRKNPETSIYDNLCMKMFETTMIFDFSYNYRGQDRSHREASGELAQNVTPKALRFYSGLLDKEKLSSESLIRILSFINEVIPSVDSIPLTGFIVTLLDKINEKCQDPTEAITDLKENIDLLTTTSDLKKRKNNISHSELKKRKSDISQVAKSVTAFMDTLTPEVKTDQRLEKLALEIEKILASEVMTNFSTEMKNALLVPEIISNFPSKVCEGLYSSPKNDFNTVENLFTTFKNEYFAYRDLNPDTNTKHDAICLEIFEALDVINPKLREQIFNVTKETYPVYLSLGVNKKIIEYLDILESKQVTSKQLDSILSFMENMGKIPFANLLLKKSSGKLSVNSFLRDKYPASQTIVDVDSSLRSKYPNVCGNILGIQKKDFAKLVEDGKVQNETITKLDSHAKIIKKFLEDIKAQLHHMGENVNKGNFASALGIFDIFMEECFKLKAANPKVNTYDDLCKEIVRVLIYVDKDYEVLKKSFETPSNVLSRIIVIEAAKIYTELLNDPNFSISNLRKIFDFINKMKPIKKSKEFTTTLIKKLAQDSMVLDSPVNKAMSALKNSDKVKNDKILTLIQNETNKTEDLQKFQELKLEEPPASSTTPLLEQEGTPKKSLLLKDKSDGES